MEHVKQSCIIIENEMSTSLM